MKKERVLYLAVIFMLCVVGIVSYVMYSRYKGNQDEILVKENQELLLVQVTKICGNEIYFAEVEEVNMSDMGKGQAEGETKSDASGKEEMESDETQQGRLDSGQMPGGGNQSGGEMPSVGNMPPGGNMSERGGQLGDVSDRNKKTNGISGQEENREEKLNEDEQERKSQKRTMYKVKGEEQTMIIPVGTTVTTQFGTTTTFSRLAAGDVVKILMEKNQNGENVIVGIWMVG